MNEEKKLATKTQTVCPQGSDWKAHTPTHITRAFTTRIEAQMRNRCRKKSAEPVSTTPNGFAAAKPMV